MTGHPFWIKGLSRIAMAFEPGHKHGAKSRLFDGALRRAIAQADGDKLREAADALLNAAAAGEPWAIGMLADRLDGKAQQSVQVTHGEIEELSIGDLKTAIAAALGGSGQAGSGADQPSPVH